MRKPVRLEDGGWKVEGGKNHAFSIFHLPSSTFQNQSPGAKWPPDWWHHASLRWQHLRLAVSGLVLALCVAASTGWADQAGKKEEEKVVQKEVTGEVVWVGKRAISVEYEKTDDASYEILLPFDGKAPKLERIKSLTELRRGDTVRVQYNQTLKKAEQGEGESIVKTVATTVALVRQAPVQTPTQSSELVSGQ